MDDYQKLLERTTINFPRSVDKEEAIKALEYISRNIGHCAISYNFSGLGNIRDNLTEGDAVSEDYLIEIRGNIFSLEAPAIGAFSFIRDNKNILGMFSGMKFETTPGYELEEIPESEIKLYDLVRKRLEDFFRTS